jgi:hypothetical protein
MDVMSWIFLTDTQISTLTYLGEDGAKHPLHLDDYLMLLVFKLYISRQLASGTPSDVINVSCDDFDTFVRSDVGVFVIQKYQSMFTVAPATSVNRVESPKLVTHSQPALPGPVTSMTGPHNRSSTNASMNKSCRFVLPMDPVSASELDVSREWKDRSMSMHFLYEICCIGISGHSDNMPWRNT